MKIKSITGVPWQGYYTIWEAVRYICAHKIQGNFVECGVQNGAGLVVMASAISKFEGHRRQIYGYDTFEGMSEPSEQDYMQNLVPASVILESSPERDGFKDFCYGPINTVRENLNNLCNYPSENFVLIKGKVEETIPNPNSEKSAIALLKLDTDWYESTKHELVYLYPKLSRLGVLIVDDYGCWQGSRKATEEFFSTQDYIRPFLVLDSPHGSRVALKV
jgi:O-methyltransferase